MTFSRIEDTVGEEEKNRISRFGNQRQCFKGRNILM
jgi:hypothetical protein